MDIANKTKITFKKAANEKKKVIFEIWVIKMVEFLSDTKFLPQEFKLDYQRTSPIIAKIANVIGQKYKRFFIWTKTKFHTKSVKVKIAYFKMFTFYSYCRINK